MNKNSIEFEDITEQARQCHLCQDLALGPRPVFQLNADAKILIIGQAPGTRVHASGIPWNDPSGNRLRNWLGVSDEQFYDPGLFAILPMGLCYPGKGKSGDLPPKPICATTWHQPLLRLIPNIKLTLLIGQYAQHYYLPASKKLNLTERVKQWQQYLPEYYVLPHPSPRNIFWLKRNPWFEQELVPHLAKRIKQLT